MDLASKDLAVEVEVDHEGPAGQRSLPWSLTRPKRPRSSRPPWPSWSTPSLRHDAGLDVHGRPTFVTTSPKWWVHGRVFGGMVVAQALNAAMRTVPDGLVVHSLHGYFLRPTSPGSQTTHVVDSVRDGRSFSTRQVTSDVEGRETFRMTCSFHAPEVGDSYQLPIAPAIPQPAEVDGFEAPFPFDIRELGATERREDGTYPVDPPLLVPHAGAPVGRPGRARGHPGLLLGHDRGGFPSPQPRCLGHAHRRQP